MKRPDIKHYEKFCSHPNVRKIKISMNSETVLDFIYFIKHLEQKIKELKAELKQQRIKDEYDPLRPPMGGGAM